MAKEYSVSGSKLRGEILVIDTTGEVVFIVQEVPDEAMESVDTMKEYIEQYYMEALDELVSDKYVVYMAGSMSVGLDDMKEVAQAMNPGKEFRVDYRGIIYESHLEHNTHFQMNLECLEDFLANVEIDDLETTTALSHDSYGRELTYFDYDGQNTVITVIIVGKVI